MGLTPTPDTSELALMTQPVEFILSETIVAARALRCKQNPSKDANGGEDSPISQYRGQCPISSVLQTSLKTS
jgi:hypothetical protein